MGTKRNQRAASAQGRFAYDGLDRAIHEKARLGILTSLSTHRAGVSFNDLKDLCSLTDGNLSRHLAVLIEAGLIDVDKTSKQRRPQTVYKITSAGRARFLNYIQVLEAVVADAAQVDRAKTRTAKAQVSPA